ncbi:MAG: alpha-hydroxy acid oxidase [Pseudomonadota bacterium]|nr:alpha-hydroxy acid oxidase [Pseudomonadota bacterium]
MSEFATLHEIVKAAHRNLSPGAWDYLTGGADTETSLLRNRQALDSLAFKPMVLNDVREIDLAARVHGKKKRLPIVLAPMGSLDALDPGGALSVAKAAEDFGVISYLSSVTRPGIDEIASGTSHEKVFQLYVRGDREWISQITNRAIDLGYIYFCLTVDVAIYSRRERDLIKRYKPSGRARNDEGWEFQAALDWDLVKWFKDTWDIPLILKGIATAEDAARAVGHGVDVVYVSNHGGRQLDHSRGTIDMLPEIVREVGGKAEIVIDGGFCRGADIVKALARGADAVAIGKIQGLGLAAAGQEGVVRVLELLEVEMNTVMGLLGLDNLERLTEDFLEPAQPVVAPAVLSAFPFLNLLPQEY